MQYKNSRKYYNCPRCFCNFPHTVISYHSFSPNTYGDVYFVRFLRIQLYKITRKLLQNVFCRDSCTFFAMDKKFPWRSKLGSKLTVFWVHKDMSKSYREGIDQKLKTMAFPYKMKGWQKSDKLCIFIL